MPVFGNVYLLSTLTAAPRLMHDGKLTGCFVSDDLLAKVYAESVDDHLERAAQQVAMYRSLGAAGVDVAGVPDFATFTRILQRAAQIGTDWQQFQDNLYWPAKEASICTTRQAGQRPLCDPDKTFCQRFFNFSHRAYPGSPVQGLSRIQADRGLLRCGPA